MASLKSPLFLLAWIGLTLSPATARPIDFGDGGQASIQAPAAQLLEVAFQPRYVHSYRGTLVQGQNFWLGLGDDNQPPSGTKLEFQMGSQRQSFPVSLAPAQSYRLRCKVGGNRVELELDGKKLGGLDEAPPQLLGPYLVGCGSDPADQFFGRIQSLRWDHLGWNQVSLAGGARWQGESPWPVHRRHLRFPFGPGSIWNVIQGFDSDGGSHRGYAAFCLDLKRPDRPEQTAGSLILAGARGQVVGLQQTLDSDSRESNRLGLEMPGGEVLDYLHFQRGSARVREQQSVSAGQVLAQVGDVGAGRGNHHLHLAWLSREMRPFVTMPFVLERFQASSDGGRSWVERRMALPAVGEWIRAAP